jgi:hypothetical protein
LRDSNWEDFLGDPNFPEKAMASPRGLKIRYFQGLYKQYSRLAFTHIEDRPIAIAGLENRLRTAYGTKGGYGIFDDGRTGGLFHRSLLWRRGDDEISLERIHVPRGSSENRQVPLAVPTWSWMAYKGGIDYLDPPFKQVDWEKNDIHPPWTKRNENGSGERSRDALNDPEDGRILVAIVRGFDYNFPPTQDASIVYDVVKGGSDGDVRRNIGCVVVAREKGDKEIRVKSHFVLIVVPVANRGEQESGRPKVYERVGAGYMPGRCISLAGEGIVAHIR